MDSAHPDFQKVSVLIADENEIFQAGLAKTIRKFPFINELCVAQNTYELFTILNITKIDIVIIDINIDDHISAVIRKIKELFPGKKIIGHSSFNNPEAISATMHAGIEGFFLKNINSRELEEVLDSVIKGTPFFKEDVKRAIYNLHNRVRFLESDTLQARRMREILLLICKQFTTEEIAERMNLNIKIVERHRATLFKETGSKNIVGLVLFAIRNNIFQDDTIHPQPKSGSVKKIS